MINSQHSISLAKVSYKIGLIQPTFTLKKKGKSSSFKLSQWNITRSCDYVYKKGNDVNKMFNHFLILHQIHKMSLFLYQFLIRKVLRYQKGKKWSMKDTRKQYKELKD